MVFHFLLGRMFHRKGDFPVSHFWSFSKIGKRLRKSCGSVISSLSYWLCRICWHIMRRCIARLSFSSILICLVFVLACGLLYLQGRNFVKEFSCLTRRKKSQEIICWGFLRNWVTKSFSCYAALFVLEFIQ